MIARTAFGVDLEHHYSKVIKAGELIFIKSNIGMNPDGTMPEDVTEELTLALEHLVSSGETAGGRITRLLKVNIYVADADRDGDAVRLAARSFFEQRSDAAPPALTIVGSALSWAQLRVQIDAVAAE